ncbi:MAG: DUF3604 domain-containing protein [Alphaproteobacteria bacterium]|nr:DUF3604 domain-containing protein [Alphaproteobacteria bacterium]|tara:strand:- start:2643 stop:4961 length:2319 start_codon:yes stop_codon:yes gene_type:complete
MTESVDGTILEVLKGEVWPVAHPGEDPVLYGHVTLEPNEPVQVRSSQTFHLTYTVGRYGLDDTGAIRVAFHSLGDWGGLQTTDPAAPNYVTANTSSGVPLNIEYSRHGVAPRPRWKALTVRVTGGYLREGDNIRIVFGDTSGGSPGMTMQTFVDAGFEFKTLADVCAVGHFVPVPNTPALAIVPGPPVIWRAVLSSLRRPGERFRFGLKAEDAWGNPTDLAEGRFSFESSLPVDGLPREYLFERGRKSASFDGLTVADPGLLRIRVKDEAGQMTAESHPMLIREGDLSGYWGDLHGQSGESIGVTTSRQYFDFARNKAFLDVTSHQANDFQVNNAFWAYLNELTAEYHQDGHFVTFPGYEWSGNTAVGGDRNVFFRTEGRQIRRSSHALLTDRSDLDTDAPNASLLFEALADENCVVYAHVGGRYADTAYAHDPRLETAMEIHSAWGTFEWLLTDGFTLGHRCGVVCNSDGHKGRPGASYPGASNFGAYGGLTCFLTNELTRDAIFDCLRRRHHYGTTGTRLHIDVGVHMAGGGNLYADDPRAFPDTSMTRVDQVMMGDIVQTDDDSVSLTFEVIAQTPIERIEIRNGAEVVTTRRSFDGTNLGNRIRILWSGAEYRGRGRDTNWRGEIRLEGAKIQRMEKINTWNHERLLKTEGTDRVVFDAITTGNYGGVDLWLDETPEASIEVATNHGTLTLPLNEIGLEDQVMEAGGLKRQIKLFRLPAELQDRELSGEVAVPLSPNDDNPLWISVYTEDGFQAWSSPVFAFRQDPET